MLRCMPTTAVYVRISQDRLGEGDAVARQEELCRSKITQLGWTDPVQIYSEGATSALAKTRPVFNKMLADVEAGKVSGIVAYHLDRLTRTPLEIERIISLADEHKLKLATVSGDIDLSTDTGRVMARVIGAFARGEVERKSQRQKDANFQKARDDGGRTPRRPVFGWNQDGTLNTTQAQLIKQAYKTLLESEHPSLRGIYTDWNSRNIATSTGGRWTHNAFRLMLLRPRNAGLSEYRGQIVGKGSWQPIVSPEDYETVKGILTQPQRLSHSGTRTQHLLSYILMCSCGGKTISGRRRQSKVYRCIDCSASISHDVAHRKVLTDLINDLARPELRRFFKTDQSQEALARIDAVRAELAEVAKKVEQLTSADLPWETLLDTGRKLQEARRGLEEKLAVLLQGSALVRLLEGLYEPSPGFDFVMSSKKKAQLEESRKHIMQRFSELNLDQQRQVISGMYRLTLLPATRRGGRVSYEQIAERIRIEPKLGESP
jgi:site-specific DNA recombinase